VNSGDLRPTKHSNDVEMETITSERRASENERKIEREKEERQIVIPRLPRMFGPEEVRTPASWKYHVMAHKYGEVWCPETQSCILGYKYLEGLADDSGEHRVKVVRYRGDTWLDVDQKKVKVFYDYEGLETVAQVSFNNVTLSGCGANHDQATRNLQQEVKRHTEKLKDLETNTIGSKDEEEDEVALIDMFMELARRDEVASQENQSITVGEDVIPVETDVGFSKFGRVYSIATIHLENQIYSETGETVNDAVNKLADKISQGMIHQA